MNESAIFANKTIGTQDAVRPAPLWLVRTCARLLSRQLVRPNGLLLTVQGVLNANDDPSQGRLSFHRFFSLILFAQSADVGVTFSFLLPLFCSSFSFLAEMLV